MEQRKNARFKELLQYGPININKGGFETANVCHAALTEIKRTRHYSPGAM